MELDIYMQEVLKKAAETNIPHLALYLEDPSLIMGAFIVSMWSNGRSVDKCVSLLHQSMQHNYDLIAIQSLDKES